MTPRFLHRRRNSGRYRPGSADGGLCNAQPARPVSNSRWRLTREFFRPPRFLLQADSGPETFPIQDCSGLYDAPTHAPRNLLRRFRALALLKAGWAHRRNREERRHRRSNARKPEAIRPPGIRILEKSPRQTPRIQASVGTPRCRRRASLDQRRCHHRSTRYIPPSRHRGLDCAPAKSPAAARIRAELADIVRTTK